MPVVADFGTLTTRHEFAVNLASVIMLGLIGAGLLAARPPVLLKVAVAAALVFCLADWVLVEDLGFMGGLGTDPNSMIPLPLLVVAGYLALTRRPENVTPLRARRDDIDQSVCARMFAAGVDFSRTPCAG